MQPLPPLRLLTTFAEVARLGSMQEAAGRLNVTRPAVTQALKNLEAHIGLTLLDRSRKPARLTDAGQQLAWAVEAGLGQIATAIADMQAAAQVEEGQLTLSCTLGMATYWLMPRLPQFYALHPDVTVNVQAPSSDLPALRPGIDIALRYGSGGWTDGQVVPLFHEEVCPVGHPDLVERLQAEGRNLSEVALIHVASPEARHWATWSDYLQQRGLAAPKARGQVFDNYVQAVQAMQDGRGLMLGWRSITGDLERDGSVARWPGGALDLGTGYHLCIRPAEGGSGPVEAFQAWVLAQATAEAGEAP